MKILLTSVITLCLLFLAFYSTRLLLRMPKAKQIVIEVNLDSTVNLNQDTYVHVTDQEKPINMTDPAMSIKTTYVPTETIPILTSSFRWNILIHQVWYPDSITREEKVIATPTQVFSKSIDVYEFPFRLYRLNQIEFHSENAAFSVNLDWDMTGDIPEPFSKHLDLESHEEKGLMQLHQETLDPGRSHDLLKVAFFRTGKNSAAITKMNLHYTMPTK